MLENNVKHRKLMPDLPDSGLQITPISCDNTEVET